MSDEHPRVGPPTPGDDPAALTVEIDGSSRTLHAHDGAVTIGREAPSDILVPQPGISRVHVRLEPLGRSWSLSDAGSRNGVYLDGRRISDVVVDGPLIVHLGNPEGVVLQLIPSTVDHVPVKMYPDALDSEDGVIRLRVGTAVTARREELGLSVHELADDLMSTAEMVLFEHGGHWPGADTRAVLEQRLKWPGGTFAAVGAGAEAPDDDFTEVLSPTVRTSVAVDAAAIAVRAIRARVRLLSDDESVADEVAQILGELRRLDLAVVAASRNAPGRIEVAVALAGIRGLRAELVLWVAGTTRATLGQRVAAIRHRGGLTVSDVAAAAGVSDADVDAVEAEARPSDTVIGALERFVTILGATVS